VPTNAARLALFGTLLLFWLNFLLTSRWAGVPGALHGSRKYVFAIALATATLLALRTRSTGAVAIRLEARVAACVGLAAIGVLFFVWFPISVWRDIPLPDNWPARFQSTVDGLALLGQGTFVGWQWQYLGGYPSSTDLTVTLTVPALLPMLLAGDRVGFHLAHLLLFLAMPALVWLDLRHEPPGERLGGAEPLPSLALALTAMATLAYSYIFLRSGDTNSVAAVVATMVVLVGSHATAARRWWGPIAFVGGLTLVLYAHAGFFVYAAVLLTVEAAFYRDWRRARRSLAALAAAVVASLPLTWEAWRYPAFFTFNNVMYDTTRPMDWGAFVRQLYYNVEMLVQPGRWLNDFTGLTLATLPVTAVMLARREGRAGFYAAAALATVLLTRLNAPEFGYAFIRPIHLMGVFTPAVIAAYILRYSASRALARALIVVVAVYLQVLVAPVPHAAGAGEYQPELVDRLRTLDGALVLVENTFHRDMVEGPGESDPTPFISHFQSLLAAETGKRLYAGVWDGWQWSPYRGQLVAGGAWMGRALEEVPRAEFLAELRRWGIRHLLVVHDRTRDYLRGSEFIERPPAGRWAHFELADADVRSVVTAHGTGRLTSWDPLGATIELSGVSDGDRVIVRTNYHPAWTAHHAGTHIAVRDVGGQIAFDAPADGSYLVHLEYPRRSWLLVLALVGLLAGISLVRRLG
jgi:hypothetical protein